MPPLPTHHYLKSDDVRAMEAELFNNEMLRLAVKNLFSTTVNDQRLRRHHPKSAQFPCVNSFCEFCLLKNTTINLPLFHPAKCRFQPPVLVVPDVERSEVDYFLHHPSSPPSLPGTTPLRRDAHPYHQKIFFRLCPPVCRPCPPAGLPPT